MILRIILFNELKDFLPQEVCAAGQRRCPYLFPRLREARCKRRGVPRIGTRCRQAPRRAAGGNGAREEMMPTSSYSSTSDLATILPKSRISQNSMKKRRILQPPPSMWNRERRRRSVLSLLSFLWESFVLFLVFSMVFSLS